MDGDGAANWRPTQGDGPADGGVDPNAGAPAGGDWRTQYQPEERSRIVNMIIETLKKQLPVSMPEGLSELHKIAVRFEERIYTAAINQSDYLRKISLKIVSMESQTKTQQNLGNAQVIPDQNPHGPGPGFLPHPQGSNPALSSTIPLMSQQNQLQQSQQHMMSQFQSQPNQLQQQWLQTSAGMLLQQNNIDQQKQYVQGQMGLQEAPSTSADSTAQTGHPGTSDLQEELYEMIKSLKDQYFAELNDLYNKVSIKIQHIENYMPAQKSVEQYEKIKGFKVMLERTLHFLQVN